MEFLSDYGLFLARTLTILIATLVLVGAVIALVRNNQAASPAVGRLTVRHLNADYERAALTLKSAMLPRKAAKAAARRQRKAEKDHGKKPRRRVFVIDFQGDLRASAVDSLREEVTAILTAADPGDEVVVRLESPGGLVPHYGLAAAQLLRLRDHGLKLTVAVDRMAASGGYMMACVANRVIAAPFAILGSIGVIAQLPNFNRWLKQHDIDYEQYMAGEHKRTVTVFGENTEADREKFQQEIEDTHTLFKDFVTTHRPHIDLEQVATGQHWYGSRAIAHRLADELRTSDDYLLNASREADLYHVSCGHRKPLLARLLDRTSAVLARH